jgi:hypothetical protein
MTQDVDRRHHAVAHPSAPIPVQTPSRRSHRLASLGVLLGAIALVAGVYWTGGFAEVMASGFDGAPHQATAVHAVTYTVTTARGARIDATYNQSRGDDLVSTSVSGAGSPWSARAQVSGFMAASVTASLDQSGRMNWSDTITCTIVEDGVEVAHEYANGPGATVTCTR